MTSLKHMKQNLNRKSDKNIRHKTNQITVINRNNTNITECNTANNNIWSNMIY